MFEKKDLNNDGFIDKNEMYKMMKKAWSCSLNKGTGLTIGK